MLSRKEEGRNEGNTRGQRGGGRGGGTLRLTGYFHGFIFNHCGFCLTSSAKYNQMFKCVSKTIHICTENKWTDSQVNGILRQGFKENAFCFEGSLEIPTVPPSSISSPCSASFSSDANACVKTFHEKFAANKADPSLCQ